MTLMTIPPGLHVGPGYDETSRGGDVDWLPYDKVKMYTNAFITQDGKILLGYKKRGIGKDLWNGFGGKVEDGETSAEAAVRELEEEAGITASLEHCGTLFFVHSLSEHAFHIDLFTANTYSGTITESEEMRPQWFSTSQSEDRAGHALSAGTAKLLPIPFDNMWEGDLFWMPLLLASRHFIGRVDFGPNGRLQKWWFIARKSSS